MIKVLIKFNLKLTINKLWISFNNLSRFFNFIYYCWNI